MTAEECRAALLDRFPGHATVEAIFEAGALSAQWRTEACDMFGVVAP